MKKVLRVVLSVLLITMFATVSLAGCGDGAKSTDAGAKSTDAQAKKATGKIKVGLSMFALKNPYYKTQHDSIQKKCNELGYDFVSTDAQDDIQKQVSNIEDLLTQNINLLIMNPKDPDAIVEVTKKAQEKGIPVISIDNRVSDKAAVVTTILSNNTENGKLVGRWVAQQMKGKHIKAVVISGEKGSLVGEDRRQGLLRGITEEQLATQGKTDVEVVAQIYTDWLADVAQKNFQDIAASIKDFNVILSEADVMTIACMKVLEDMGKKDVLLAAAADGEKLAFQLIKEGRYGATGLNHPGLIGRTAVEVGTKILQGEKFPPIYYTPAACVNKENVDKFFDPNSDF